jgi:hypothetical protein
VRPSWATRRVPDAKAGLGVAGSVSVQINSTILVHGEPFGRATLAGCARCPRKHTRGHQIRPFAGRGRSASSGAGPLVLDVAPLRFDPTIGANDPGGSPGVMCRLRSAPSHRSRSNRIHGSTQRGGHRTKKWRWSDASYSRSTRDKP